MNRLTGYAEKEDWSLVYNKLYKYEDLDEKLGVTYDIMMKALLDGFYYWCDDAICGTLPNEDWRLGRDADGRFYLSDYADYFYMEGYGKYWALTKEELKEMPKEDEVKIERKINYDNINN